MREIVDGTVNETSQSGKHLARKPNVPPISSTKAMTGIGPMAKASFRPSYQLKGERRIKPIPSHKRGYT